MRRGVPSHARRRVWQELPPRRCRARSRSGERCRRWAIVGGRVCYMHGGASPQAKAAAVERRTLAEALARGDRRHPADVLASALHTVDVAASQLLGAIADGQQITPEVVEALLEAAKQQAQMARVVLDANGGDPDRWAAQEVASRQGEALGRVLREALRLLGHPLEAPVVTAAVQAATRLVIFGDRAPAREFAAAHRQAIAAAPAPQPAPPLPDTPPTAGSPASRSAGPVEPPAAADRPEPARPPSTVEPPRRTRAPNGARSSGPRTRSLAPADDIGPDGTRGWEPW